MVKDFDTFFDYQLKEPLIAIENIRYKAHNTFKILIGTTIVMGISLWLFIFYFPNPMLIFIFSAFFLAPIGFANYTINKAQKRITPLFKNATLLPMLEFLFEEVIYVPRQKMPVVMLNESLLRNIAADRVDGDDFVSCKIGDTYIQFCDLDSSFGPEISDFGGLFVAIQFNKSFKTKTVVKPKKIKNQFSRLILNLSKRMKNAHRISMENSTFNRNFITLGEDQIESRYILTPALMERLLGYQTKVKKHISFSFIDDIMYMAISYSDFLFEPRLFKPTNDKEFIRSNYDFFVLITDVVNDLDLNTKIWK